MVVICLMALNPSTLLCQIVDLKISMFRTPTAYISTHSTGFGTDVDINLTDKFIASLKYGFISNDIPFVIRNMESGYESEHNTVADRINLFELNFYYPFIGTRNSFTSTKFGIGVSYQKSKTSYLAFAESINGIITMLDKRDFSSSSNRLSLSLQQQVNLTKKLNFHFEFTAYIYNAAQYPIITSVTSSSYNGNSTNTNFTSSSAPYNQLKLAFGIGYKLFDID